MQLPIESSIPWFLVEHVLETSKSGVVTLPSRLPSIFSAMELYNDAARSALYRIRLQIIYNEVESEVNLCFDMLVDAISDHIFADTKCRASRMTLDQTLQTDAQKRSDLGGSMYLPPQDYNEIFDMDQLSLLGRSLNLRVLVTQKLNKRYVGLPK